MNRVSLGRRGIFGTLLLVAVLVVGVAVSRVSATPQPTSTPESVSAI
jgi:ABC-type transporter Mla subunit MlaD